MIHGDARRVRTSRRALLSPSRLTLRITPVKGWLCLLGCDAHAPTGAGAENCPPSRRWVTVDERECGADDLGALELTYRRDRGGLPQVRVGPSKPGEGDVAAIYLFEEAPTRYPRRNWVTVFRRGFWGHRRELPGGLAAILRTGHGVNVAANAARRREADERQALKAVSSSRPPGRSAKRMRQTWFCSRPCAPRHGK